MQFTKMHGLQNDYIYIDTFQERVTTPHLLARAVSDRHEGIGSDGLILVGQAQAHANADVRMRIFNADGSEAQMCGNGIRCVTKFVVERGLCQKNPLRIETARGTLLVSWSADAHKKVQEVCVDMGRPILEIGQIPAKIAGISHTASVIGQTLEPAWWKFDIDSSWMSAAGCDGKISLVSMGNPHVILWCERLEEIPLERIGPLIETHASFPERMNVHFANRQSGNTVSMRTWERGSGMTRACGTGACAVVVAGVLEGKLDGVVQVHLPGGMLSVNWLGGQHVVSMSGPAVEVCTGTLSIALAEKAN